MLIFFKKKLPLMSYFVSLCRWKIEHDYLSEGAKGTRMDNLIYSWWTRLVKMMQSGTGVETQAATDGGTQFWARKSRRERLTCNRNRIRISFMQQQ